MSAGAKYTDPCDHITILDNYRKEMDDIEKLAPNDIEDIGDVKGYIKKLQEEARARPQWITDMLTTLQDAGTDEAAFEMVERLTEELIEKEERIIAMEKKVEDYDEVCEKEKVASVYNFVLARKSIRYKHTTEMYKDIVYTCGDLMEHFIEADEYNATEMIYRMVKNYTDIYDKLDRNSKGFAKPLPLLLLDDITSGLNDVYSMNYDYMTADDVIDQYNIDITDASYTDVYNEAIASGKSEAYANNAAISRICNEEYSIDAMPIRNVLVDCLEHNGFGGGAEMYETIWDKWEYFIVPE